MPLDMNDAARSSFLIHQVRFSNLVNRNIIVDGHRTSVRLEPAMWTALNKIAERENLTIHQLGTRIDRLRDANCGLTAAIRVFLLAYFQEAATEEGHERAGHGSSRPRDAGRYKATASASHDPAVA
jgi:predicted DNA-binding ribbon-helix-helix protein